MKYPLSSFSAAAAAIAAMVQYVVGTDHMQWVDPEDLPAAIPRMTAKMVEKYALTGATDAEIADRFLVDASLIKQQFADVLRSSRGLRNIVLRGYQTEAAKKLNATALSWLGRNELGQTQNPSKTAGGEDDTIETQEM